jgi:carbonic anhydrase/acetyltransferase-like protein (isoleucine patch superfamily)
MALVLPVHGRLPQWGEGCFLAPNATLTGDVVMGMNCSVWFNAVVRGDVHHIRIGDDTNIQDGAIVHCTYQTAPTTIGSRVTIGHGAIVHGCTIEDEVLIGMGAIVLDGAIVGKGCLVAAGAVVTENARLEPGYLYAGIPAKKVKPLEASRYEGILRTARNYPGYASSYGLPEEVSPNQSISNPATPKTA